MDASVCPCARVQLLQPAVPFLEAAAEAAVAAVHKSRLLCTRRGCCAQVEAAVHKERLLYTEESIG